MSPGNHVDAEWLKARGFLHNARVISAELVGRTIRLGLDDEWSNAPREQTAPGTLVVVDVILWAGEVATWLGGRVREIEPEGQRLAFRFYDREDAVLEVDQVLWEPA